VACGVPWIKPRFEALRRSSEKLKKEKIMETSSFIYVTYIAALPDKVFKALIDPKATKKYWQHENVSDWKPGSGWEHRGIGKDRPLDMLGKVIEYAPPRRIVLSWASPEDEAREEKYSRVTLDVESYHKVTRLTVTHDGLEPGSEMLKGIIEGWPMVLSSLKTLMETGHALPVLWDEAA
jgi:uncharacterized protein YndB with AHSA1/START domain